MELSVIEMKCETKVEGRTAARWTLTDLFCPYCSAKAVWEAEEGDYYSGPQFLCASCGGEFFLPDPPNPENIEMAKAIREAEYTLEPSDAIPPARAK